VKIVIDENIPKRTVDALASQNHNLIDIARSPEKAHVTIAFG